MKKSTYNRCSEIVSIVKKSTASMLDACARRNARQDSPRTFAGRAESRPAQDLGDGRRRDGDAEPVQLARDPLVAPARVLARQPEHQCADLLVDRRSTASTAVGPVAGDEPPVPARSVVGLTMNDCQFGRGSSRLAAASNTRSAIVSCGRLV